MGKYYIKDLLLCIMWTALTVCLFLQVHAFQKPAKEPAMHMEPAKIQAENSVDIDPAKIKAEAHRFLLAAREKLKLEKAEKDLRQEKAEKKKAQAKKHTEMKKMEDQKHKKAE